MSAQHTPGPWTFGYYGCNGYCIQGGGQHIATSILYKKDGGEANARLIAAAPDLIAFAHRLAQCEIPEAEDYAAEARALIAKVEGGAS